VQSTGILHSFQVYRTIILHQSKRDEGSPGTEALLHEPNNKELPVIVHVNIKLLHKEIIRVDSLKINFRIGNEELLEQDVILVISCYIIHNKKRL
jgi:hypothetical protein